MIAKFGFMRITRLCMKCGKHKGMVGGKSYRQPGKFLCKECKEKSNASKAAV